MRILKYDEYVSEMYSVNEEFIDLSKKLRNVFKSVKGLSVNRKKDFIIYALSGLLVFTNVGNIKSIIRSDDFIKKELDSDKEIEKVVNDFLSNANFKHVPDMRLSQNGWDMIKWDEGDPSKKGEPVLKAYKLGDGMITIGWGHAEPIGDSKFKVGDKITLSEAQKLLSDDLKVAADGVRRIFSQWESDGIERRLTQEQFDVLVSMAFNMGVGGLRKSETIKNIKNGDYEKAGESIKTESINPKFSGLKERRKKESNLFLTYINNVNLDYSS